MLVVDGEELEVNFPVIPGKTQLVNVNIEAKHSDSITNFIFTLVFSLFNK